MALNDAAATTIPAPTSVLAPGSLTRSSRRRSVLNAARGGALAGLIAAIVLLAGIAATVGLSGAGWLVGVSSAIIASTALAHGISRYNVRRLGLADWVTLTRATLAIGVAALVATSFHRPAHITLLVSLSALALALDAVDGWIARRTATGALGARFDGEVDAFLILVLSVYVSRSAGAWVLAIGAARYAFLAASLPLRWMRAPLPPRYWRKVVTATQGIVLTVAAADVLPRTVTQVALVGALVLLAESFGRDVGWLWRRRRADRGPARDVAAPQVSTNRMRTAFGVGLTVLAGLVVWTALVAPNQPQDLTLTAFFRIPLEGLVLVVLAAVLPRTPRRILAGVLGPVLAVLVILKIFDIAFFTAFARPFDIVGDAGDAGIGIQTLHDALGNTEADVIVYGGAAVAVTLVVVTTLSMFRLTRVAAEHRRWSLCAVGALAGVWLLCAVFGAKLLPNTPVASASTASYIVSEVRAVQADIRDQAVFARQIRHDPLRNTPGSRLLTGLRGTDVLLVFVESYGQVSVEGSSLASGVDSLLEKGTAQLKTAGFSAESAFLGAPGFGGLSWFAHSTLQSGVWANSQERYDQLVASDRFTLSDAFNRAGWRTINFAPADDRFWPDGLTYYHYDKLYNRSDMGYRGPTYNYAPMPDQYMYLALQRLELGKTHRRPLFAEVDTVSSHMPWNRIPPMIPWREVGNGSIFNRDPGWVAKQGQFWPIQGRVRSAYFRSLEYSLRTLISFVQHYGKKNLVLVVVGDEQPLGLVSGQHASHEVPISIIAHDPSVLKRIGGWGWQSGLLPSPKAPVWPMSAFRDRFLTAYGPQPVKR